MLYIIALGDAFDGISLYGPFDDAGEAKDWAIMLAPPNKNWRIIPINDRNTLDDPILKGYKPVDYN